MHAYVSNIPPLRHCFLVIYHSTTKQGVEICTTKLEGSDLMLVRGRTRFPGRLSLLHTWRAQDSHDECVDWGVVAANCEVPLRRCIARG